MAIAHSGKGEQTMQQLLEAALKLFAEKGFRATSIRDIVTEAGSNVAAVNYHFGSKDNLYREVFRRHKAAAGHRGTAAVKEVMEKSGGKPSIAAVLEAFALASKKSRDPSEIRNWNMLMNRELTEPQLDPHFSFNEVIEPLQQDLGEAIAAACPGLTDKTVHRCVHSFIAQLAHLRSMQVYFSTLGADELPMLDTAETIRHIVRFTSAGIDGLQKNRA
jgi:AcrR family transcriptional regulator